LKGINRYLNIINSYFRNFAQAGSHPKLNVLFTEALDEILEGFTYGIFAFDSFDNSLKPLPESANTLESMHLEEAQSEIVKHLREGNHRALTKKNFSIVPHQS